jgi:cell filamentation protein
MFDPFGDFATRGYLRNLRGDADPRVVKASEHNFFEANIDEALQYLAAQPELTYEDFLAVHRILFSDYYPWAGQDRTTTMPNSAVHKGDVLFSHPRAAQLAVEYGLRIGQNSVQMNKGPGEVMGAFAHGHPFLDGNGRTMLLVHTELCHRAGFAIDWHRTSKADYLGALTEELDKPGRGILDAYLTPFKVPAVERAKWGASILAMKGLDGLDEGNQIDGDLSDPVIAEKYRQAEEKRGYMYEAMQSLAPAWNAKPGRLQETGQIVALSDAEVIQDAGRGRHVVWDRRRIQDDDLAIGESVTIHESGVVERPAIDRDLGR